MKILYDYQAFTYQTWGGVSKSFCELLTHRPTALDYDIAIRESDNVHLKESQLVYGLCPSSRTLQTFCRKHRILGREKVYRFLEQTRLFHTAEKVNKAESIRKLKEGYFDVFHPTFYDDYFLHYLNGKPFVLTVHDLMPELFGWWKGDSQIANKPRLLKEASAVIAVSENTKDDLCRMYDVPRDKVHVVYHGYPEKKTNALSKRIIDAPYFLYVGRRCGYKNFEQTVHDFGEFYKLYPEVKYVLIGPELSETEEKKLKDNCIYDSTICFFASDEELASLYAHAIAFIFPSLYEGFGMPILEAFSYGCPVLLNNKSCFPEIGGDAALYFESDGIMSNLLEKMVSIYRMSQEDRTVIVSNGYRRLELFSWTKSAKILYDVYQFVLCK